MPRRIKNGQQRLAAGRENFIFFLCPLDGVRFRFPGLLFYISQEDQMMCVEGDARIDPYTKAGNFQKIRRVASLLRKQLEVQKKETPTKLVGVFVGHAKRPVRSGKKFVNTHNRHSSGNLL